MALPTPDPGPAGRESPRESAGRGHAQVAGVDPVGPPGRVLVELDPAAGGELLPGLVQALPQPVPAELLEARLGGELPGRTLARLLQRLLDRLLAQLLDQALEDLLDGDPGGRDQPGRRGRRRAQRQGHRDGHADQLDQEQPDLDPGLELRPLDVAAAILDEFPQLVGDRQQRVERRVLVGGELLPGAAEGLRAGAAVGRQYLTGRVVGLVAGLREPAGDRVPAVGDVPGGLLVAFRPVEAHHPFERLVGPLRNVERAVVQRVGYRAGQDRHERSLYVRSTRTAAW
ncbi:hypothetical protein [Actinoplanes sp. NPDC049118]|uniref:hypothetical protein n=1 Tax=Actinoplanes sp. NPDC049118 TaxID=3155769 RepID=UPI0033D79839